MSRARTVTVLPDIRGLPRHFDYRVPAELDDQVRMGTIVRVDLHGRRVRGWVVSENQSERDPEDLKALLKVTGWGPGGELVDLAQWAAWRWAGSPSAFLSTASPSRAVTGLPEPAARPQKATVGASAAAEAHAELVAETIGRGEREVVLRLPPDSEISPVIARLAADFGPLLVLVPEHGAAQRLGTALERAGEPVAVGAEHWPAARAGGRTVVGTRAAAWAPCEPLGAVIVLDEHDESYAQTQAPTWNARDVARERARRAGVPCVMFSPAPSGESLSGAALVRVPRAIERAGWPAIQVVDQRVQDPARSGLVSEALAASLREEGEAICVLNRKGRSRLLACASCREVARCENCGAAVNQMGEAVLACPRCGTERPEVCLSCGRTRLSNVRRGISRVREDLEALLGEEVGELSAGDQHGGQRVVVGTEAVLHRRIRARLVAFLDFDQELLAARYRASEQALTLLARAGRAVGGRGRQVGRVLVQTSVPEHPVILAAAAGDPSIFSEPEMQRRQELRWPPAWALAVVSGEGAEEYLQRLGNPAGLEILGPLEGKWLLRAADHETLCGHLGATMRSRARLRIEVDPLRI